MAGVVKVAMTLTSHRVVARHLAAIVVSSAAISTNDPVVGGVAVPDADGIGQLIGCAGRERGQILLQITRTLAESKDGDWEQ